MVKISQLGEEQVTVATPLDVSLRLKLFITWGRSGDLPLALDSTRDMENRDTGITKFTEFHGQFPFT